MHIIKHDYKQNETTILSKDLSLSNSHLFIENYINEFMERKFGNSDFKYLDFYPEQMKYGAFVYYKPHKNLYKFTVIEKRREEGYLYNTYHYLKIFSLNIARDKTFRSKRENDHYNNFCLETIKSSVLEQITEEPENI